MDAVERPLGLAQPRIGEIDVGDADGDLLPPRAMEGAQERRFGGLEVRFARVELAFDRSALDLDEVLARRNAGAGADQQFGDGAGHRGADREHVAATFDPPRCGHCRIGWRTTPAGWLTPARPNHPNHKNPAISTTGKAVAAHRVTCPRTLLRVSRMTSLKAWSPHTQNASTSSPEAKSAAQKN